MDKNQQNNHQDFIYNEEFTSELLSLLVTVPYEVYGNSNYAVDYGFDDVSGLISIDIYPIEDCNDFKIDSIIANYLYAVDGLGTNGVAVDYENNKIMFKGFPAMITMISDYIESNPQCFSKQDIERLRTEFYKIYKDNPPEPVIEKKFPYEGSKWPRSAYVMQNAFEAVIREFNVSPESVGVHYIEEETGEIGYIISANPTVVQRNDDGDQVVECSRHDLHVLEEIYDMIIVSVDKLSLKIEWNDENYDSFIVKGKTPHDFLKLIDNLYGQLSIAGIEDNYLSLTTFAQMNNLYGEVEGEFVANNIDASSVGKAFEKEARRHIHKIRQKELNTLIVDNGANVLSILPSVPYTSIRSAKQALSVGYTQRNMTIEQVTVTVCQELEIPLPLKMAQEEYVKYKAFTLH